MTHEPNCSKQFSNFYYRYAQGTGTGIGSSIFFANSSIIECQFCMDLRNKMCWEIKQQNKLDSRCNVQVKKTLILYVPVPVHTDCIIIITHSGYCIVQTLKNPLYFRAYLVYKIGTLVHLPVFLLLLLQFLLVPFFLVISDLLPIIK